MPVDVSRLSGVPLFSDLSADELVEVASHLEERNVSPGAHLSNEGGAGYFFFIIDSGTAQVSKHDEVVAELGPGDFFGEVAVLEAGRRTATVTAQTAMTVFAMFGADFALLEARAPSVHKAVAAAIEQRRA
jgi:CRP/FNR family cyclic AMP-dependent transcriptional regulator